MIRAFFAVAITVALGASAAGAEEVKLLSAFVLKPAITDLAPEFERVSGHTLAITYESAGVVRSRIQSGEAADVTAKLMKASVAEFAAHDTADIVISQPMEILATPGYELVGWLPEELQDRERFTWAAGVTAHAKEPEAARALIQFLSSPAAAAVIKKKG